MIHSGFFISRSGSKSWFKCELQVDHFYWLSKNVWSIIQCNFSTNNFWSTTTNSTKYARFESGSNPFSECCNESLIITIKWIKNSWNTLTVARNHYGPNFIIIFHYLWSINYRSQIVVVHDSWKVNNCICPLHPFCGLIWEPYI